MAPIFGAGSGLVVHAYVIITSFVHRHRISVSPLIIIINHHSRLGPYYPSPRKSFLRVSRPRGIWGCVKWRPASKVRQEQGQKLTAINLSARRLTSCLDVTTSHSRVASRDRLRVAPGHRRRIVPVSSFRRRDPLPPKLRAVVLCHSLSRWSSAFVLRRQTRTPNGRAAPPFYVSYSASFISS